MIRHALSLAVAAAVGLSIPATAWGAVLPGVPSYEWYYGCSPTAGGMIVGYWDGRAGYEDLFDGDASVETQAVRDMIASPEHLQDPYSSNHAKNSIADFMETDLSGLTEYGYVAPGLAQYIEWDNPNTPINEGYEALVERHSPILFGGDLDWALFKSEIDASRPVVMNMTALVDGAFHGHTLVGYGYQDDMFQVSVLAGEEQINLTVGGMAVRDTWPDGGTTGSQWRGWDGTPVEPIIDQDGVEWWPWVDFIYVPDDSFYDWRVLHGITVDIVVPEPSTVGLLALPFVALLRPRRLHRRLHRR